MLTASLVGEESAFSHPRDRPSGSPTFQPNRRITDWPADIQAFVSHVRVSRFAVLGGSGGGPYALACAHALPKEMLSAMGVMAGVGLWEAGMKHIPWSLWGTYFAATYFPSGLRVVTDALVGLMRGVLTTGVVTHWIDNWLEGRKREKEERKGEKEHIEEDELTTAERRERILGISFEGFAQGAAGFV